MIEKNIELVRETLEYLISLLESDDPLFFKEYKSLPIDLYREIERLSLSKSMIYRDLCEMSKKVADAFHKSIK